MTQSIYSIYSTLEIISNARLDLEFFLNLGYVLVMPASKRSFTMFWLPGFAKMGPLREGRLVS